MRDILDFGTIAQDMAVSPFEKFIFDRHGGGLVGVVSNGWDISN